MVYLRSHWATKYKHPRARNATDYTESSSIRILWKVTLAYIMIASNLATVVRNHGMYLVNKIMIIVSNVEYTLSSICRYIVFIWVSVPLVSICDSGPGVLPNDFVHKLLFTI